jgi:AhpC/TSA family
VAELVDGCVKPARGPILPQPEKATTAAITESSEEANQMIARVGKQAIDFEANAYVEGVGFQSVKLSSCQGKWVVLCFYPGDFTFV